MSGIKRKLVKDKDLAPLGLLLAGALLLVVRLVLCSAQNVYLYPEGSPLDDMVMYDGAVSITQGNWLGDYGWLTLSKHAFFSLWLAVLHTLGIPYLMGGQLLWAAAALAGAWALAPVWKKRWPSLLLFAVLLYNPAAVANPAPNAYITRVYRDNIFPALCLLCVAGMVGFALRHGEKLRRSAGWLVVAGLGLGGAWLTREDGWWLLPFVLAATLIAGVFILRGNQQLKQKLARCACLGLPFLLLAAGVLGWCAQNQAVYGRFIISDFAQGEFADAYGAMTRIEHESWDPMVDVPKDVREKLYEHVPAFAELEPLLESRSLIKRYAPRRGDYNSGSFYWALREAAARLGYYDSPETARAYFAGLARDINALCDNGTLPAGPARTSVSPPIRREYVVPVLGETLHSLVFCATFQQCDARSMWSPGSNNPWLYEEMIQPMEAFLGEKALTATKENSDEAYYSPFQRLCYGVFDFIRYEYTVLLPHAFVAALGWQLYGGVQLWRRLRKKQAKDSGQTLVWFVGLGLLCCVLLRCAMIAFVTVSSFEIGTYVMYLASVHPLMLLYGFLGVGQWVLWWRQRRRGPKEAPGAAEAA